MKKIRKAVIPAAGYGTRLLPETKAVPKEMLPIIDKPIIQYIIEELVDAGIEQIIIVTGFYKRAIEYHFDRHLELERKLEEAKKYKELEEIKRIASMAEFVYVRQKEARGNGDAILTAKNIIGDEPFIVCWGDDFILSKTKSRAKQLIESYEKYNSIILGSIEADKPEDANKFAFIDGNEVGNGLYKINRIIEKPGIENKPSNIACVSGSVLIPEIFEALESVEVGAGKELVYVDGVNVIMDRGIDVYAKKIENGKYYDCGNILEYLKTNVELAIDRDDIGQDFKKYLAELLKNY